LDQAEPGQEAAKESSKRQERKREAGMGMMKSLEDIKNQVDSGSLSKDLADRMYDAVQKSAISEIRRADPTIGEPEAAKYLAEYRKFYQSVMENDDPTGQPQPEDFQSRAQAAEIAAKEYAANAATEVESPAGVEFVTKTLPEMTDIEAINTAYDKLITSKAITTAEGQAMQKMVEDRIEQIKTDIRAQGKGQENPLAGVDTDDFKFDLPE